MISSCSYSSPANVLGICKQATACHILRAYKLCYAKLTELRLFIQYVGDERLHSARKFWFGLHCNVKTNNELDLHLQTLNNCSFPVSVSIFLCLQNINEFKNINTKHRVQ